MTNGKLILALNSGSSSLKFALYDGTGEIGRGSVSGIGEKPKATVFGDVFRGKTPDVPASAKTVGAILQKVLGWLEDVLPANSLLAVGHRIVHGGKLEKPELVTRDLRAYLKTLIPLAPLHQPFGLEAIDIVAKVHKRLPQVACFDTAFHRTMPRLHQMLPLPRKFEEKGLHRYGFHGLSYEFIAGRLASLRRTPKTGRVLVAHLGNGASLCALKDGVSFETTMGFSALSGLMMGTRPGNLDPGVLLYLIEEQKLSAKALEKLLYHECGLLGVSGVSSNMSVLLASKEPKAKDAVQLFVLQILREAGSLISMMGGLDRVVFTGGIGEHAAPIREAVSLGLGWAGTVIDSAKNRDAGRGEVNVSGKKSKADIWVIPTDEEAVIAHHTRRLIKPV